MRNARSTYTINLIGIIGIPARRSQPPSRSKKPSWLATAITFPSFWFCVNRPASRTVVVPLFRRMHATTDSTNEAVQNALFLLGGLFALMIL